MKVEYRKYSIALLILLLNIVWACSACSFSNDNPPASGIEEFAPSDVGPNSNSPADDGEGSEGLPTPEVSY